MSETLKLPMLPWRARLFIAALSLTTDLSRRSDGTVNRRLLSILDRKVSPSSKPVDGVKTSDVMVDTNRNLWFRLFVPTTDASSNTTMPVIIYFHGGGFVFLAANSKPYDDLGRRLSKELNALIVSVNYRLAPEIKHPGQRQDGIDVLKFIDEKGFDDWLPPCANLRHCFIAGDSAGGNLAHNVAYTAAKECHFSKMDIIGLIPIQPYFGGEERVQSERDLAGAPFVSVERTDWTWKAYLPVGSNRDDPAVNVFGPNGVDIREVKFPATLLIVGGFDPLKDWQNKYCEGLKEQGKEVSLIEYPNAVHSFYAFPQLAEFSMFIKDLNHFIIKQSAPSLLQ